MVFRPVLVLQNNIGNCFSPTIIIAAITGVNKKSQKFPTHYHLKNECGLTRPSVVMLEQIRTIDKKRLKKYIGHLNAVDMNNIDGRRFCKVLEFRGAANANRPYHFQSNPRCHIIFLGIAEVILRGKYP